MNRSQRTSAPTHDAISPDRATSRESAPSRSRERSFPLLNHQQLASNQSIQRALNARLLQAKLAINRPADRFEQEADRIADSVVNGESSLRLGPTADATTQSILRAPCTCGGICSDCMSRTAKPVRGTSAAPALAVAPPIVDQTLRSQGQPLPDTTRRSMESYLGADFRKVRIHTGDSAAESARAVNALAYTVGHDVVFDSGQYAPSTSIGRRLLSHELVHVVQQTVPAPFGTVSCLQREPAPPAFAGATQKTAWDDLPADARDVLQHSFDTSDRSRCNKPKNPEWIWCGQTAADSFNHLAPGRQAAFRALYQALQAQGLWDQVDRVSEVQVENDRGISGTTKDNNKLMLRLLENSHFCADTPLGGALHKGEKTWRQVVASSEGLHVGVGGKNQFSAHLDDLAPVAGREKDGQCRYSYRDLFPHLSRDVLGLKNVDFFPRPQEEPQPGEVQPVIRFRIPGT